MQIALVAVVLLAGMWFTVLKPKPADESAPAAAAPVAAAPAASSAPVAPGVKGLANAVDKAKAASSASDAANAKIQSATGGNASAAAAPSKPAPTAAKTSASSPASATAKKHTAAKSAAKAKATTPAAAKGGTKAATPAKPAATVAEPAAKPAVDVDPSGRLLAYLKKGKTLVVLFEGKGVDDKAARKAVHRTAKADPKHVVSAYVPISQVGRYEAITSDVQILSAPTILVIGTDGKATPLTGYVDATVVRQAVADARRAAAAAPTK